MLLKIGFPNLSAKPASQELTTSMEPARNPQQNQLRSRRSPKAKKKAIKITYISSPMKVKASSPSEFRAIVQELTGFHSAPPCLDAWTDQINDVDDVAARSISAVSPVLDQSFIWREASDGLPVFQFPCVFG